MHAYEEMLNGTFRQEYGFGDGVYLSDCNDINVLNDFRYAANATHAAAMSLKAGVDLDLMCGNTSTSHSYQRLGEALRDGLVSEADLDRVVRRILTMKFATGAFDAPYADETQAEKKLMDSP